jgi:hypothetical protein
MHAHGSPACVCACVVVSECVAARARAGGSGHLLARAAPEKSRVQRALVAGPRGSAPARIPGAAATGSGRIGRSARCFLLTRRGRAWPGAAEGRGVAHTMPGCWRRNAARGGRGVFRTTCGLARPARRPPGSVGEGRFRARSSPRPRHHPPTASAALPGAAGPVVDPVRLSRWEPRLL